MAARAKVKRIDQMLSDISHATGVDRKTVLFVLRGLRDDALISLQDGYIYRLLDVGNFRLLDRAARKVRNPRTQEMYEAPPSYRVKFKSGSAVDALIDARVNKTDFPRLVNSETKARQEEVTDPPPKVAPPADDADELRKLLEEN